MTQFRCIEICTKATELASLGKWMTVTLDKVWRIFCENSSRYSTECGYVDGDGLLSQIHFPLIAWSWTFGSAGIDAQGSVRSVLVSCDDMLQYALQRIWSVVVWSVGIPSNILITLLPGFDVYNYVLPWKFLYYACVILICMIFLFGTTNVLCLAFSVCAVIASCLVRAQLDHIYEDGIANVILIHCDSIRRCRYPFKWTKGLGSNFH